MKAFAVALILATFSQLVCSYKILALFPMPAPSHFVMYRRLLTGLVEKGHEVDVLGHFPLKNPMPRYTDLSLKGTTPDWTNNVSVSFFKDLSFYDEIMDIVTTGGVDVCETVFNTTIVKELKESTKMYDLVVTEIFGSDCMLGFDHLFKVPAISMISSVNLPWAGDRIGNPDNPSYIPNYYSLYTSKMSLMERLTNTGMLIFTKAMYYIFSTKRTDSVVHKFFGPSLPSIEDLVRNTSLILVNSHFSINQARPTVPNFIEVAGLHIGEIKQLPQNILDAFDGDHKGIIYLCMGSMVMTESFEEDKLQGMFDAFAELPYKVLWKADKKRFRQSLIFPKNIHFEPWMPQLDILCHPKVKLFVAHGGLLGTQEAIYCGVPVLGIPLFADQDLNIQQSVANGFAEKVAFATITKQSILKAAKNLLKNPRVQSNIKMVSKLFNDRPSTALETAIYWVEYVIRHKGAPHLRSGGADLHWYQYFLVDIAVIVTIITSLLSVLVYSIIKMAFKCIFCSKEKPKVKLN